LTGAVDAMSTTIVFDDADVSIREVAVTVSVGHFATPRLGWSVGGGAIVGGTIDGRAIDGGAMVSAAVSWLPVYERPRRPFIGFSASAGTALARAVSDDDSRRLWSAWDLRAGGMVGKSFGRVVTYAAARIFGGPVFWRLAGRRVTGGDLRHVTAGAGLTVRLPRRLDATVEVMPLGEQSATAAVTFHW
jgi:hypothetical protein